MSSADPITLEALRFFARPAGRQLLEEAAALADDEWRAQEQLRAHFPAEFCRAALALVELRRQGREKFPEADRMFFDRPGLEMATRREIARYRAARLGACESIMDLCCGIGGDLLALGRLSRVRAVDGDRRRLEMARMNCAALDLDRVDFIQADVRHLRLRADVLFIDPGRREEGGRRVRGADAYSPPLGWVEEARRAVPDVAVKVSPAIDEGEIPCNCEVEFISASGQCREGVLYFGRLATAQRRATLLPAGHALQSESGPQVPVGPPGGYIYDPDPAVVRAHLLDELARRLDAWKLDPHIAYLSGDARHSSPFARAYRLLTCLPFHLKRLRRFLLEAGLRPTEIKKRRFPMTPEEVRRRLRVDSGTTDATLILTRLADRPVCLICEKVGQ